MSLFSKKGVCNICGNKTGKAVRDGFICSDCWAKTGVYGSPLIDNKHLAMVSQVKEKIDLNEKWLKDQDERRNIFTPTIIIGEHLMVDEANRLLSVATGTLKKKPMGSIFSFDEIEEYELDEDGESVTKGGLGRAAAGGLLFGGVGAVVGGVTGSKKTNSVCTKMNVIISIKGQYIKTYIQLVVGQTKRKGILYKAAQQNAANILKYLDKITAIEEQKTEAQQESTSVADELKKYADLKAAGAISEEEYNSIKNKLLANL